MTDKEKIKAEVTRLRIELVNGSHGPILPPKVHRYFKKVNEFIDSLPEEHASDDLDEKSKKYAIEQVLCTTETRMSEQAYLSLTIFNGYDVACAYKDGAENNRELMMKEAIDGVVTPSDWDSEGREVDVIFADDVISEEHGIKDGDKVKLIIVKED